jgi:quinol-cytochrome oxidoreductase complex cytochrome b subunit
VCSPQEEEEEEKKKKKRMEVCKSQHNTVRDVYRMYVLFVTLRYIIRTHCTLTGATNDSSTPLPY